MGGRPYLQHLSLNTLHGAGAWISALPTDGDLRLDPPSFRVTVARRLRLPIREEDSFCPRCGGIMDRFGDHALTCPCAGDRTRRHNALRNIVHEAAKEGGLGPVKEKAGLLPASMDRGGAEGGLGPPPLGGLGGSPPIRGLTSWGVAGGDPRMFSSPVARWEAIGRSISRSPLE